MKRKNISQEKRDIQLIIESKSEIKKLFGILEHNRYLLNFYNGMKNEQLCSNAKINLRKLILENLEIYKELKFWKKLIKNILKRKIKEIQKDKIKSKVFNNNNNDEYDNYSETRKRDNLIRQEWNNYLYNFSK